MEKPVEVVKTVQAEKPKKVKEEGPKEVIKEVIKEVPSEPRIVEKIVEKIVEVPKIEYVY